MHSLDHFGCPKQYLGKIANEAVAQKLHRRLDVIVIVLGIPNPLIDLGQHVLELGQGIVALDAVGDAEADGQMEGVMGM